MTPSLMPAVPDVQHTWDSSVLSLSLCSHMFHFITPHPQGNLPRDVAHIAVRSSIDFLSRTSIEQGVSVFVFWSDLSGVSVVVEAVNFNRAHADFCSWGTVVVMSRDRNVVADT